MVSQGRSTEILTTEPRPPVPPTVKPSQAGHRQGLLLVALVGLVLRLGLPGSVGIDHFDEGIYAFAGEWPYARGGLAAIDPAVIPYGPPVTPVLIGAGYILLGGPSDFAAVLPGIACGSLAVLLVARLAGRLFSPQAGLFAALLLAVSGEAVAFSRSALTDAPLLMFWLVAMLAGWQFLKSPGFISAIGMGLGVGLCQLTKYNGALTGVIVALTAVVDFIFVPRGNKRDTWLLFRRLGWGLFGALIAVVVYAPWFQFVERHGGYRALMKHHNGYMGGMVTWPAYLKLQLAQAGVFQYHWLLIIAGCCGLIFLGLCHESISDSKIRIRAILATCLFMVIPNAIWVGAVVSVPALIRSGQIGRRMVAVWLVFLSLLTPFYHPYARLWLPTLLASLVVAGLPLDEFWLGETQDLSLSGFIREMVRKKTTVAAAVLWLAVTTFRPASDLPGVWSGRGELRAEVAAMVPQIQKATASGQAVSIFVSPAVRWQLRKATPPGGFGPGRIVTLGELKPGQPGPLLVDAGLLNPAEFAEVEARQKRPSAEMKPGHDPARYKRGLITILDQAPGAAQGETLSESGLIWLAD